MQGLSLLAKHSELEEQRVLATIGRKLEQFAFQPSYIQVLELRFPKMERILLVTSVQFIY